jgi:hypothetical protein
MKDATTFQTSNGHTVTIDAEDSWACSWAWIAVRKGHVWYVCRTVYSHGGRHNKKTRRIYLHRVVLKLGSGGGMVVDHLNGDGLDNRKSNLRVVTSSQNQRNRAGAQVNSASGVRGVYWHAQRSKWAAAIRVQGKNISLGLHDDMTAAIAARLAGEKAYWSEEDRMRATP